MRLRDALPALRPQPDVLRSTRATADVPIGSDAPAYVWPLNPWGGVPFRRAQA